MHLNLGRVPPPRRYAAGGARLPRLADERIPADPDGVGRDGWRLARRTFLRIRLDAAEAL